MELIKRPRRLRGGETLRKMVRETRMDKSSLIYPLFVMEGNGIQEEIPSMEGQYRYSLDRLPYKLEQLEKAGLSVVYQDERLTTVTATNALIEGNMHRAERKHNVDKVAAAVILQQYLDTCRNQQQQEAAKMEEQDNIIELIDDETGAPIRFQHLATIEHEGELYIALSEVDAPEDGQCEVFIMQVAQEEDGTESYIQVEDETVQQAVFDKFLQLVNEGSGDDE